MNRHSKHRQDGLALVELMVALVLGLFVSAAIAQLFLSAKRSHDVNEAMARVQENGRFAMSFLLYDMRMADYNVVPGATRIPDPDAVKGENDSGLNKTDTVTLVYEEIENGSVAEKAYSYSIQNGKNGLPSLFRRVDNQQAVEVAEGIENLQILYGEDTNDDNVPEYYVDWTSVADSSQVVALNFTVTASTLKANVASGGGRLTRDFSSTVVLRNRMP